MTRLHFKLVDESKTDKAKLEAIQGVKGVVLGQGQTQVIIGVDVEKWYLALFKCCARRCRNRARERQAIPKRNARGGGHLWPCRACDCGLGHVDGFAIGLNCDQRDFRSIPFSSSVRFLSRCSSSYLCWSLSLRRKYLKLTNNCGSGCGDDVAKTIGKSDHSF